MSRTTFEDEWRARFDRFAARGGSDATISGWSEHGMARRLKVVTAALDANSPEQGSRVLDLGCGAGAYCLHLRERGFAVVGVDYSRGMLGRARAVVTAIDGIGGVDFATANLLGLPFRDDAFEAMVNVGVLQHVADGDGALREFARILSPGAHGYLVTLNRFSLHATASTALAWVRAWSRGQLAPKRHAVRRRPGALATVARRHGFDIAGIRGVYVYPSALRWLEPVLDGLDRLRLFGRPVTLPFANAFLLIVRR